MVLTGWKGSKDAGKVDILFKEAGKLSAFFFGSNVLFALASLVLMSRSQGS